MTAPEFGPGVVEIRRTFDQDRPRTDARDGFDDQPRGRWTVVPDWKIDRGAVKPRDLAIEVHESTWRAS